MGKFTFQQFQAEYPNDEVCLETLMQVQYGGTEISCPGCGVDTKFHLMSKRKAYSCQECGHHIYPCADTIFNKSRTNLTKWFFAMYLMTSTRHGVAAKELQRQLVVTYKCAWRMAHELRKLMATADHGGKLSGHIEIDEMYVGGKFSRRRSKNPKATQFTNKTIVFGMVERDGMVRAGPVSEATRPVLEPIIRENVERNTTISTDENGAYNDLVLLGMKHGTVKHYRKEYVRGIHHTNTIEGYWGQFKRSVKGTHVSVSGKHLWKYIAEFSYRRNYRTSHSMMFNRLVAAFALPRLQEP
jgi:transposase